jgi:hypothetical protein
VAVVAAGIDADTAAVGLTFGAATTIRGANAAAANAAGTGITAGPAVCGIRGEIAAAVDRAAKLDPDRAVRPLADAAAALDRHELTLANLATRTTVVHIGLKIDAGANVRAVG